MRRAAPGLRDFVNLARQLHHSHIQAENLANLQRFSISADFERLVLPALVYFSDERGRRHPSKKQLFQAAPRKKKKQRQRRKQKKRKEKIQHAVNTGCFLPTMTATLISKIEDLILHEWPTSFSICSPITIL